VAAELALCHVCRELATISSRPSERIERAVDKAYANGIKTMEFGGQTAPRKLRKAVLAAL